MRRSHVLAGVIVGGAVTVTLIASPALAAGRGDGTDGRGSGPRQENAQMTGDCDGTGTAQGTTRRMGGTGGTSGTAARSGAGIVALPSGDLTDAQASALVAMAEEEKLAHDIYVALGVEHSDARLARVARAELRHLDSVRLLLDRYELTDLTADQPTGVFTTPATQEAYDAAVAKGSESLDAAYAVASTVETADIADLKAASKDVTAPDVLAVYANLLTASERHLDAFSTN